MAVSASHAALPYPIKNARYSLLVPMLDADGDGTAATTPDTEVSKDNAAAADCAEEISATSGMDGMALITLTGAETDCSCIALNFKSASGPKATLATLYPRVLASVGTGTMSAGSAGGGTLGTLLAYDVTGCFIMTTGGTGGGGTGGANNQVRKIVTYNTGTGAFTVVPNWETTPSTDTTYSVLLPEGVTLGMLKALNPTTPGATLDVTPTGAAGVDWGNVENKTTTNDLSGTTIAPTQKVDVETIKTQAVTAAAGVTFPTSIASPTNITAGTITTVTNLTNLPAITAGWLTATGIASGAITNAKFAAGAIDAAAIANGAIDAATFAADVDAEFLSYIVDDATQIDASALNTATGMAIPNISAQALFLYNSLHLFDGTLDASGSTTSALQCANLAAVGVDYTGNLVNVYDNNSGEWEAKWITDHTGDTITLDSALSFTPEGSADKIYVSSIKMNVDLVDAPNATAVTAIQSGLSTHSAADVWAVATRVLTANTNLNDPTAAAIADAVWTEAIADHSGVTGSTAEALNAAGAAGDPWTTALPGAYGAGSAGKIIGDNLNATVSSRSSHSAADVWAVGTRVLTAGTNIQLPSNGLANVTAWTVAITGNITGNLSGSVGSVATGGIAATSFAAGAIDAAALAADAGTEIGTAVWASATRVLTAGTNIQLPSNGLANVTAWTVAITGNVTGSLSGSVGSVTGAVGSVTGAVGSVTGSVGSLATQAKADVNAEVVDALATDVIADSVPADGSRPTIAQALYMLVQFLTERSVSSTTLTVKKPDGSTSLMTFTLNDATTPTAITRAT